MKPRRLRPEEITREGERDRIIASFKLFSVPPAEQAEILEAMLPDEERRKLALDRGQDPAKVRPWDWFHDCDGCTAVSEDFWPTKYFPPCLRHDFDCIQGAPYGGAPRFYRLSRRYRMTRARAGLRWLGVTLAWAIWIRWRPENRRK